MTTTTVDIAAIVTLDAQIKKSTERIASLRAQLDAHLALAEALLAEPATG